MPKKKTFKKTPSKQKVFLSDIKDPVLLEIINKEERYKGEAVEPMRMFAIRLINKYKTLNYSQIYQVAQVLGCLASHSLVAAEGRNIRGVTSKTITAKRPTITNAVAAPKPVPQPATQFDSLLEIKALADKMGGTDVLKSAVETLEQLRS